MRMRDAAAVGLFVGGSFIGYKAGEFTQNATEADIAVAEAEMIAAQGAYDSLVEEGTCEYGVLTTIALNDSNYYAAPKSAEQTTEALISGCSATASSEQLRSLGATASYYFSKLHDADKRLEATKDRAVYSLWEKIPGTYAGFMIGGLIAIGIDRYSPTNRTIKNVKKQAEKGGDVTFEAF